MLQEFQSARSVIALLQEDMNNIHESRSTRQPNSVQCGEQIKCESSKKWIPVVDNHKRRLQKSVRHLAKQDDSCIPTSIKCMLLNNLNDSTSPKLRGAAVKNRKSAVAKVKKRRVVLIGDSYIKRCLEKISNSLDNSCNMNGITKPNASLEAITLPIDVNVDGYTKDDVFILIVGTMNVARNETNNGLRHLTHFVRRTSSNNILILDIPHCLDLVNSSCANKESIVYNRKFQIIVKTSNHVQIQTMSRDRTCYTKYGMHMISLGKNWMCQEITKKILDLLSPKSDNLPIPLYWKAPHSTDTTPRYSSNSTVCSLVMNQHPLRKKTPTTRNEDFLWD